VPNYRHDSQNSAAIEAERLAKENPEVIFHVLKVVASVKAHVVQWRIADNPQSKPFDPEDIPF